MQALKAAPSSRHRKVALPSPSVKEKLAVLDALAAGGAEVIVGAGGGVRSIVQL